MREELKGLKIKLANASCQMIEMEMSHDKELEKLRGSKQAEIDRLLEDFSAFIFLEDISKFILMEDISSLILMEDIFRFKSLNNL